MRLIDADKLFEKVGKIKPRNKEHYKSIGEFMNMITNSETIDTMPKGEWKYGNGNGECPFCGRERQLGWDNYCGYCGARMRE